MPQLANSLQNITDRQTTCPLLLTTLTLYTPSGLCEDQASLQGVPADNQ